MAEAFKCDRCGEFYTKYGGAEYKVAKIMENCIIKETYKELDLCSYCSESLAQWYKSGKSVKEE